MSKHWSVLSVNELQWNIAYLLSVIWTHMVANTLVSWHLYMSVCCKLLICFCLWILIACCPYLFGSKYTNFFDHRVGSHLGRCNQAATCDVMMDKSKYFQSHPLRECPESIYGPKYEYISFFAIEYEYIYPLGDMDISPYLDAYMRTRHLFAVQNRAAHILTWVKFYQAYESELFPEELSDVWLFYLQVWSKNDHYQS